MFPFVWIRGFWVLEKCDVAVVPTRKKGDQKLECVSRFDVEGMHRMGYEGSWPHGLNSGCKGARPLSCKQVCTLPQYVDEYGGPFAGIWDWEESRPWVQADLSELHSFFLVLALQKLAHGKTRPARSRSAKLGVWILQEPCCLSEVSASWTRPGISRNVSLGL